MMKNTPEKVDEPMEEMGNKSLVRFMVDRTDVLTSERFKLLKAQEGYMKAKESLLVREAELTRVIINPPEGKQKPTNELARKAELTVREHEDKRFQELINNRNDCWHVVKVEEAIIERIHNELLNARVAIQA